MPSHLRATDLFSDRPSKPVRPQKPESKTALDILLALCADAATLGEENGSTSDCSAHLVAVLSDLIVRDIPQVELAISALEPFTWGSTLHRNVVCRQGAVPPLIAMVRGRNARLQSAALRILSHLADGDSERHRILAREQCISPLLQLLRDAEGLEPEVAFMCSRTLTALAPYANRYYVLLEDDWLLCEGGLEAIRYLVRKASVYQPAFSALRFSYGLNGLLLPAADVPALASFLRDPAAETENKQPDAPVDHLSYRWLRGKYAGGRRYFGRRHMMAFRHTLFWHIGDASAVGNTKGRHRPKCYGLTKEWLFEQESFHADECPDDDVWPCRDRPVQGSAAAFELGRLAALVERRAPGAHRCGSWRVCWERPAGQPAMRASQCAARLLCSSGASTTGAASVDVVDAGPSPMPCVPREPQYEDRQGARQRGML
jgi:hypothetical protein